VKIRYRFSPRDNVERVSLKSMQRNAYLRKDLSICRCRWQFGLRSGSEAVRLLGLRVRIPPGTWFISCVCCLCCVGSDLCDELITRPEESYRVCMCVSVCDIETSTIRWPRHDLCCCDTKINKYLPAFCIFFTLL
jgi:hypothetical protein